MAVANTFTFGGVSTTTYSVIVEGAGDYSGAKRAVEMVSIPGRNGAFALDKGYFENEPVEYDVLIQGATQATFETAVSSFRNAILSKTGYQRLTDTYHPNEYRMAVYSGGFDEEPTFHGKGASFKVKFDCQPQRYLTSGETKQTIAASGDTIANPTLFDSKPLLEVVGYGDIGINGSQITVTNRPVGTISLCDISKETIANVDNQTCVREYTFDNSVLNAGDSISVDALNVQLQMWRVSPWRYNTTSIQSQSGTSFDYDTYVGLPYTGTYQLYLGYKFKNMSFINGTAKSYTRTTNFKIDYLDSSDQHQYEYAELTVTLAYDGNDTFTLTVVVPPIPSHSRNASVLINEWSGSSRTVYGDSTKSALGNPLYIDLDIGEAYKIEGDTVVSVNDAVTLSAELPVLNAGANTITFDNTITDLKIVPRWWKL